MRAISWIRTLALASGMLVAAAAWAQTAASRPIRMIVPLPAGTATDLAARVLSQQMSTILGQTIVVDNKPGANGTIGVMDMVRAAPDGHTLLLGSQSPLATNVAIIGFEILVALLQAYVFAILTSIYLHDAVHLH